MLTICSQSAFWLLKMLVYMKIFLKLFFFTPYTLHFKNKTEKMAEFNNLITNIRNNKKKYNKFLTL